MTGENLLAHLEAGTAFLLLDGLDEVPVSDTHDGAMVYPRDLLLSGLADALPVWLKAGNRVLLTSRPYGLDEEGLRRLGLPRAPLDPVAGAVAGPVRCPLVPCPRQGRADGWADRHHP